MIADRFFYARLAKETEGVTDYFGSRKLEYAYAFHN